IGAPPLTSLRKMSVAIRRSPAHSGPAPSPRTPFAPSPFGGEGEESLAAALGVGHAARIHHCGGFGVQDLAPAALDEAAELAGGQLRVVADEDLAELEDHLLGRDVVAGRAGPVDALDRHHAEGEHQVGLAAFPLRGPAARLADVELHRAVVV